MRYDVVYIGEVVDGNGHHMPADRVEHELDGVMDELCRLQAPSPAIAYDDDLERLEISLNLEAADLSEALIAGSGIIRAAIHAAGGFTPGWQIEWCDARATRATVPA